MLRQHLLAPDNKRHEVNSSDPTELVLDKQFAENIIEGRKRPIREGLEELGPVLGKSATKKVTHVDVIDLTANNSDVVRVTADGEQKEKQLV